MMKTPFLDGIIALEEQNCKYFKTEDTEQLTEFKAIKQALSMPDVVGRSEQLVSFLHQYQKACEIMHVNKIDAKNFVEQYKTN